VDRGAKPGLMCPSPASTRSFDPGLRLSTSDRRVQDCIRELQALSDRIVSSPSSSNGVVGSFAANCLLPLSPSQSRLLAEVVTTLVPPSTWWWTQEESDWWALCGVIGEDSGPQVTVFISATSDRDVLS